MTQRNTWIGALLITFGVVSLLAAKAHELNDAAPKASIEKSFAAEKIALRNLSAELHIDADNGTTVRVTASGEKRVLDALQWKMSGAHLEISQPPMQASHNAVHVERNMVITRDGGRSTTIIGGTSSANASKSMSLALHVAVPRDVPVTVSSFAGNLDIGTLSAPVSVELLSGTLSAGRLGPARLSIVGGGEIAVARIDGSLDLEIAGSGDITVQDGDMPFLSLETSGASTVFVGGRVGAARLSLNGVSTVTVAHVDREPEVDANGVTSLRIGNR